MVGPERKSLLARARVVAVVATFALAGPIVAVSCGGGTETAAPTTTTSARRHVKPLPPNAVRIQWKKRALVPAAHAGRLCIVTVKTGHFCASYRRGQIPATALKIRLLEHGFIPVAVGPSRR